MSGFFGKTTPDEKRFMEEKAPEQKQWLRSQIPALLTPEVLSLCERRMKRTDIECTLAARTTSELVEKCRWKPTPGPRGMGLGWE